MLIVHVSPEQANRLVAWLQGDAAHPVPGLAPDAQLGRSVMAEAVSAGLRRELEQPGRARVPIRLDEGTTTLVRAAICRRLGSLGSTDRANAHAMAATLWLRAEADRLAAEAAGAPVYEPSRAAVEARRTQLARTTRPTAERSGPRLAR